jgi:hypothetical protein
MGLLLAPILEDKLEAWKSWSAEITGEKRKEFEDLNRRYELTRHDAWLAETPNGPVAVVLQEGSGGDTFMQKLAQSNNPFDIYMKQKIESFHGMDLSAPPPGPAPVKMI